MCMYIVHRSCCHGTMNILNICELESEPSCKIGVFSATIFRKALYRKWPLLSLSLSQHRVLFVDIMSTRGCGTPALEKRSCALPRKRIPMTGKLLL